MDLVPVRLRQRRYDLLADAVAALLSSYDVARPPGEEFDVRTGSPAGEFEEFVVLRDFAVRLGEAEAVEGDDDDERVEVEVHAHHLVALVAAFPDLVASAEAPEPELQVVVQGLCQEYLSGLAD